MKKRNLVIVAFMLVAAMTIGVGYAALSVTLNVNGTASVSGADAAEEFKEDVYFSNAEKVKSTGTRTDNAGEAIVDTITISDDKRTASFEVKTLMGVNEYVEYTFTVKNDSTMAAAVTPTFTETNDDSAYKVEVMGIEKDVPFQLAANDGEQEFTVKITLEKMPTDSDKTYTLTFRIDLDAVINNP